MINRIKKGLAVNPLILSKEYCFQAFSRLVYNRLITECDSISLFSFVTRTI